MSNSTNLQLPYLTAAQAQKHVTVNEALARLDAQIHLSVLSRVFTTPPVTPAEGDRYLVAASPTAAWSGQPGKLAMWLEGAWVFVTPREGWRMWVADEDQLLIYNGTTWQGSGVPSQLQNLQLLGVNATADTTNKLTVSSAATLFNHVGNGHQIKLNKNAVGDTASFLFQTGFSGRAEIGTTGDDAFHFKVSADGSSFTDLLIADGATAQLTLPRGVTVAAQTAPASPVNGQLWQDSTTGKIRIQEGGVSRNLVPTQNFGAIAARHLIIN
jgi:Protein of unknown function (DUF2793)